MELLQLKYFQAVAQMGKISEAAESLFISAPALSTSIARLEKELGIRLFDRTNNRIQLNRQGEIFLRYVNQVFISLDCAKTELHQSLVQEGHHVSFACVATSQWVNMITAFSMEYPQFTLSCTSVKSTELTNTGLPVQHTFLLASEDSLPPFLSGELDSLPLFEDELIIAVHPDHPLANREWIEPKDLTAYTLLMPMKNYALYENLVKLFEAADLPIPNGAAYSHVVGMQLATKGLGVAFAFRQATISQSMALRYIPIRTTCRPILFRVYWRKNHPFTPDELVFKHFLENYYAIPNTK